ncbi:hypothetical protein Prudu_013206 [Prunus dulcis]|uniref:Uncharacterized protein n=1 Tax=Prunus dulcis TaxID=3755 RepID=A0A4Y1RF57_PRUDU|nr:hypothetical protein Prudu_013206 [Prunus dulcis]
MAESCTGPDPNSGLESKPDLVRVRHLANVGTNDLFALLQRKGAEDGKRPGGGFLCTSTAWGRKTFKKNVSETQSQPKPQTGRIQGTVVSLIIIPCSHGPGVPETREANVKCTDKTEGKLDVRGHRHI